MKSASSGTVPWLGALAFFASGLALAQEAAPRPGGSDAVIDAARTHVRAVWEKEMQPQSGSSLSRIEIHSVERRSRLAPGHEIHLVHAFAEASWWKLSEHYLLLIRPAAAGFEVLYSFHGGYNGKGIEYRLIDLGSGARRFGLEISDRGFGNTVSGTITTLVLYLPEADRFADVFREITTYWPPASHTYQSTVSFRDAEGPLKQVVVRTDLFQARDGAAEPLLMEAVESIFDWRGSSYEGTLPLPLAWRSQLP